MRMSATIGALWAVCGELGYSWVGFYLPQGDALVLGARQPKPACSPIGLNGMCGRAFTETRTCIVRDVRALPGDGYIACDPRDLSEIVVPMLDDTGRCVGVLDADSFDVGAFTEADAVGLVGVLRRAGLYSAVRDPELLSL